MARKKNVMHKNLLRTIRGSLGRYIAIVAIIALGASMFVGLVSTKSDMVATGQKYLDSQNMFDLRLLSTYGWTDAEVEAVAQMAGVTGAEGMVSMDVIGSRRNGEQDSVYKLHSIPQDINKVYLLGGRMPQAPDECLVDGFNATDAVLGTTFTIAEENDGTTLDSLNCRTYTVVGYVSTPLYMDLSRGSTSIGNGTVSSYVYVPLEAFSVDYYTEIAVTIAGDYAIYSEAFTSAMESMTDQLKPHVTVLAQARFASILADAEAEYESGRQEYEDGLADYEAGREEVLETLSDALAELTEAQRQIDENRLTLQDGLQQIADGQAQLDEQAALLETARQQLVAGKAEAYAQLAAAYAELMENYTTVREAQSQVKDGIAQIDAGLVQIDSGITQLEDGLQQIADGLEQLKLVISLKEIQLSAVKAALILAESAPNPSQTLIDELTDEVVSVQAELDDYYTQLAQAQTMQDECTEQLQQLQEQRASLNTQRAELVETQKTLDSAADQMDAGLIQLNAAQSQTENEFAAAEAQLESGQLQLEAAQKELNAKKAEAEAGAQALEEAQAQLDAAWAEYEAGKLEAETELADAKAQLDNAASKLADARKTIDTMAPAEVYILDRNTNVGYLALDNNSNIVSGVSKVFPAFFLLIAALVCITTMTRMVEEERTQIGTFKALGYSSRSIIGKYMAYAASAAVIGCGLGTLLGSAIFPTILWEAYGILLNITPRIVLQINWPLCLAVVVVYTLVTLLVTWYCCYRNLREVPAELIRPRAPTSGKKIWMEYLPFWKHISFLNKVMLRNVFRYRQRMLMMLIGIGGCTALLLTGFGLRDSIVNIVSNQFDNVTYYDFQVYFAEEQSEEDRQAFRAELGSMAEEVAYFYQINVDLSFQSSTSEVYLISTDEKVDSFLSFHNGEAELDMPKKGEALLSVGLAETMGVQVGDTVTVRDADMRPLTVTISGIFENNVYNYIILSPETIEAQWGETVPKQMAFVNVRQGYDLHETAAKVMGMADVMNVTIGEDVAKTVNSMLEALDLVVGVIVICAGALAMIVLYNLTNINITERIREIATIKVLGFRAGESAAYVFKENLLLSAFGVCVGMVMGKFLLDFVISQIKVDMVWFQPRFTAVSCVLSAVLTMLAAVLVDFLLYFKLEKINMAEALKSVE